MQRFRNYDALPAHARYIGSTHGDGSMDESVADAIARAAAPAYFDDETGRHYFDTAR